jgi:predicted metal-dependent hydrolase
MIGSSDAIYIGRGSEQLKVGLRVSKKAKYIRITISPTKGVELIVPVRCDYAYAHSFLLSKEVWIRNKLCSINHKPENTSHLNIPIFGEVHQIKYIDNGTVPLLIEDGVILLARNLHAMHSVDLKAYLRWLLKDKLHKYALEISELLQVKFRKISIKDTKTRWGSCTRDGNLSFSWRLVFAPEFVVRYLIVHELCHLLEMNHSQRFWKLVGGLCPDYKRANTWLKVNGSVLHGYL